MQIEAEKGREEEEKEKEEGEGSVCEDSSKPKKKTRDRKERRVRRTVNRPKFLAKKKHCVKTTAGRNTNECCVVQ